MLEFLFSAPNVQAREQMLSDENKAFVEGLQVTYELKAEGIHELESRQAVRSYMKNQEYVRRLRSSTDGGRYCPRFLRELNVVQK